MAKLTIEEKAARQMIRRGRRDQAKLEAFRAAHPELAAYWAGSAGASVASSYARGDLKVVVAADHDLCPVAVSL